MNTIYAFTVLLGIFAIGNVVAEKTKAILSTVFVCVVLLLIAFWSGLPANILNYSFLQPLGIPMAGILVIGVGSNMDLRVLGRQWRTVIIAILGALFGVASIMLIGQVFLGRYMAFVAGPIFAGTQVATLMLSEAVVQHDMSYLVPFILLIFVSDNLLGIPITSFILKREARVFLRNRELVKRYATVTEEESQERKTLIKIPEVLKSSTGVFARIAIGASLSFWLASLTQGHVHFLVMCLFIGVLLGEVGFLEKESLKNSKAESFIMLVVTVFIFGGLADTSPSMLLGLVGPLLITLGAGFLGVLVSAFFLAKALKVSPWMGMAMAASCSYGMPATILIPKEVSEAMGQSEEEVAALKNYMVPNMVTAGFASVTFASVFIAQIAVTLIFG